MKNGFGITLEWVGYFLYIFFYTSFYEILCSLFLNSNTLKSMFCNRKVNFNGIYENFLINKIKRNI
jgi:hypothetical protein